MSERAVLTIACGKQLYLDMASALARSFRVWHSGVDLKLFIATDAPQRFPHDVQDDRGVQFIDISSQDFGKGFETKLHFDKLAPADRTLFIDADCLITGALDPVFDRFSGHSVSTVGRMISDGDWWGDVAERSEKVGVDAVPLLVGCVYYLEDNATSKKVYQTARSLKERYEELGMLRLRGSPNEEPLVSLGMALHGQRPIPDDGKIKADAMSYPTRITVDVFKGESVFKDNTDQEHLTGTLREARPIIAHFNDTYAHQPPYTHEAARLRKVYADGWTPWTAGLYATVRHTFPHRCLENTKDVLRPLYRALFGTRHVRKNPRAPG